MRIDFPAFIDSLSFMGIGMASIIIVIGVLVIAVMLLNLFTSDKIKTSRKVLFIAAIVALLIALTIFNTL